MWTPLNLLLTNATRAILSHTRAPIDWAALHLPRAGTVKAQLPNGTALTIWSLGDDAVATELFWRGWSGYEPETSVIFHDLAARSRLTVDVGAHVGYYTLLAAHTNPAGRVIAFEPMPRVYERLQRNVQLNGLLNVVCHPVALGDRDDIAAFYHIPMRNMSCSSSLSREFMLRLGDPERIEVPVARLDTLLTADEALEVDLIKLDTEGTELDALKGMKGLLETGHPNLICEVLAGAATDDLEEFLRGFGYAMYHLSRTGPKHVTHLRPPMASQGRNYLFKHVSRSI